jgi:NAD(P)-dependent dehydrogenase (short-subunit alcohol dehydrogenase family)
VVVVHYNDSESAAYKLVEELRGRGGAAVAVGGDLSDSKNCERIIREAGDAVGGLDGLVNNAAIFHKDPLIKTSDKNLLLEMGINAFAPIYLTRAFAEQGPGRGAGHLRGRIVNLLDRRIAGYEAGALPYILSKKMLAEFTKLAALELAPDFSVNGVAPGPVLPPPGKGKEYVSDLAGALPLKSHPAVSDVAEAVAYLLSADSITGQIVFVDGGQHLIS